MANTEIKGFPELQRAIKKMVDDLPKDLAEAGQQVARDWMNAARNKANGPHANEVARSLVVSVTKDGAKLSNSHPGFFGEEFGGRSRPETMQFPPHNGQRGYFVFPAARENAAKFQKVWEASIDEATKPWNHKE